MLSDEQLMMRAARGDMEAFEALVEQRQQDALNIAYRFLGDRTLAEDVVQDAFLKILAGAARYRPTARFRTYLYNVLWRLCVDIYRRRSPAQLDALEPGESDGPSPEQAALADERALLVRRAVDELPPRQRMALVLKHFEGLSYEETGRALDCSASAVDALLSRARARLKERLEGLL